MKVIVAPMKIGHGTKSSLKFIEKKRPRLSSYTEMDSGALSPAIHVLRDVFGRLYRVFTDDKGGHSQEIPIVLRVAMFFKVIKFELFQLTKDGGPALGGMGNDRWLGRLEFKRFRRKMVYYATHTDAGVQHVAPGQMFGLLIKNKDAQARWARYQLEMHQIEEHLQADIDDKTISVVMLGGDLNMLPIKDGVTEEYCPHQVFSRLGMKYTNTRVVYFAVHGAKIRSTKTYPSGKDGWQSDHAALEVRVSR